MAYLELYNKDILDAASLGKTTKEFDALNGDYVKVELIEGNSVLYTLYSNKLLLKYLELDENYIGDYHIRKETVLSVGGDVASDQYFFYEGEIQKEDTEEEQQKLTPILLDHETTEILNSNSQFKKQLNIYYDEQSRIFIKPNEIIQTCGLVDEKLYSLRIYFLNNIKTNIGKFLFSQKNNYVENGNFFAGLEATQTGDLDRSIGLNRFTQISNPGLGRFALEQNGYTDNRYSMMITGIEPNSDYVISAWEGFNSNYTTENVNGTLIFASMENVSSQFDVTNQTNITRKVGFKLKGKYFSGAWPEARVSVNGIEISTFEVAWSSYQWVTFNLPSIPGFNQNTELEFDLAYLNDIDEGQYTTDEPGSPSDRRISFGQLKTWETIDDNQTTETRHFHTDTHGFIVNTQNQEQYEDSKVRYHSLNGNEMAWGNPPRDFNGQFVPPHMDRNGSIKFTFANGSDAYNYNLFLQEQEEFEAATENVQNFNSLVFPTNQPNQIMTDEFSSYGTQFADLYDPEPYVNSRNIETVVMGDITWHRRFKLFSTDSGADLGSIIIHMGRSGLPETNNQLNTNPLGRRYFTDIRIEKLGNYSNALQEYFGNLTEDVGQIVFGEEEQGNF